jgi:hypothetical protein
LVGSYSDITLAASKWVRLDFRIKNTGTSYIAQVKTENVLRIDYSDGLGGPTATDNIRSFTLIFQTNSQTQYWHLDDWAINNTSSSVNNSWCEDGSVLACILNGNGSSSQFIGSDGNSVDNYLLIDETPGNAGTDYVQSATTGDKDLYAVSNLPTLGVGDNVKVVQAVVQARESVADSQQLQLGIRSGATEDWDTAQTMNINWLYYRSKHWETDPNTGAAWSESAFNAIEAGIKIP